MALPDPPPHSGCTKMVFPIVMDVGKCQEQTRCSGSPLQRRSDAECSENGGVLHRTNNAPLPLTELDRSDPPPHSGCAKMVFSIVMDVGEGQKQTRCSGSPVRRRSDAECSENGGVSHRNAPLPLTKINGHSPPTTALRVRKDGLPDCHGCGRRPEAN
jgi:hypothetical protein